MRLGALAWSDIAAALRLGSRQAAEQRRLRLGSSGRDRDVTATRRTRSEVRAGDQQAGTRISRLGAAAPALTAARDALNSALAAARTLGNRDDE